MKFYITFSFVMVMKLCGACDFCGCFMGITPYDNQSSIGLLYRYKSFSGYHFADQQHMLFPRNAIIKPTGLSSAAALKHGTNPSANQYNPKDFEIYSSVELRAKYFIHSRTEINAVVPFIMNSSRTGNEEEKINGVGDITLFAGYHVISSVLNDFQHRLILGGGVKLPTGNYVQYAEDGDRIDPLLQAGSGSLDPLVYVNYIFGYKKFGMNLNSMYKFNRSNILKEQVANSATAYLNVFWKFRNNKHLKIYPSLQAYYEHSDGLYTGNTYIQGTRTSTVTAGAGIDFFYKNFSLNTGFHLPVYEKEYAGTLSTAGKLMVGLTYSFNQKKHLIKSKNE